MGYREKVVYEVEINFADGDQTTKLVRASTRENAIRCALDNTGYDADIVSIFIFERQPAILEAN